MFTWHEAHFILEPTGEESTAGHQVYQHHLTFKPIMPCCHPTSLKGPLGRCWPMALHPQGPQPWLLRTALHTPHTGQGQSSLNREVFFFHNPFSDPCFSPVAALGR